MLMEKQNNPEPLAIAHNKVIKMSAKTTVNINSAYRLLHPRHTHTLTEESGEFPVNIPPLEILQAVYACGSLTGRSFDKFKKANLTQIPGKKTNPPAIRECIAHLE